MKTSRAAVPTSDVDERRIDAGLSALLILQGITLFVVVPLGGGATGRLLLDACHLSFALVCIGVLTRHHAIRLALILALALLVAGPPIGGRLVDRFHADPATEHEVIALAAFAFNGVVTALVARHVFAAGRVTVHRVRGAVLLYLNAAALFAIAYGALAMQVPGAFSGADHGTAAFTYLSLTTITTTGFGDIVPIHPLARSLATLEAVFGQLFPATLLARLVSLNLAHQRGPG